MISPNTPTPIAKCKTCGAEGPPWKHVPSMFDPHGIGDPGHKMPDTPTPEEAADGKLKAVQRALITLRTKQIDVLTPAQDVRALQEFTDEMRTLFASRTAQKIEVAVIKHLSDISRAVGLLRGLGHPDEYLERHRNQLMAQAEEAQGQLATINEKGME